MKRTIILTVALLVNLMTFAQFSGEGEGTSSNPYLITNANELNEVRNYLDRENVYFKLANDIDLTSFIAKNFPDKGWEPIGGRTKTFAGFFNGNGKTITGLTINRPEEERVGLFAHTVGANISKVIIKDCEVHGGNDVGGLCGRLGHSSKVTECGVIGNITGSTNIPNPTNIGGLIGNLRNDCILNNCYFRGNVTSYGTNSINVGGLIGECHGGQIENCYAMGKVCSSGHAGGIAGRCAYIRSTTWIKP